MNVLIYQRSSRSNSFDSSQICLMNIKITLAVIDCLIRKKTATNGGTGSPCLGPQLRLATWLLSRAFAK